MSRDKESHVGWGRHGGRQVFKNVEVFVDKRTIWALLNHIRAFDWTSLKIL